MEPKIVTKPAFTVVGMQYSGRIPWKIPKLWRTFGPRIAEIENVSDQKTSYGLTNTYQEGKSFTYIACVEVNQVNKIPDGMVSVTVPQQQYVVFPNNLATYRKVYLGMRKKWIPENGYKLTMGPEYELYDESYNPNDRHSEFDMYIPIEKAD